jgi:hypothetical protein
VSAKLGEKAPRQAEFDRRVEQARRDLERESV